MIQYLYSKCLMCSHPEVGTPKVEYHVYVLCLYCVWMWMAKEIILGLKMRHMWDKMKWDVAMVTGDVISSCHGYNRTCERMSSVWVMNWGGLNGF